MRFSALPMRAGLVVLGLTGTASAFWRMECRSRSGLARIDPLINPGEISAHAHAIHGGSGMSSALDQSACAYNTAISSFAASAAGLRVSFLMLIKCDYRVQ